MSSCSDDCICCFLPCIVCWACVYYAYAGVRSACKFCYKKCRPGDEGEEENSQRGKRAPTSQYSQNSLKPSTRQLTSDMECRSSRPVSLQVPAPTHHNPSIRSQPLPTEQMTLNIPSRSSPSPSSSRRASPQSYSYSDRYRPHHRSSLASNSFTADLVFNKQGERSHGLADGSQRPSSIPQPPTVSPQPTERDGDDRERDRGDPDGITVEPREPHEVQTTSQKYPTQASPS
ncbi:hypothetical protein CC1G_14106 [Coprinopsis cinerea okayama7|uniref:Uncharacterized protein n=1 Tax=Coprinopsis cinerea (strain Okayama-7 / 130 / ATCC MYA-4618 / FGSC 9003) TaxID=240176 RepID=D6RLI7_COPC7|nr:hypothetical protein CC1G_14106 [Coprinopsis cinerea okayama7\|eukprot:XP_002911573.1 hypothetical protein CC1G_14106 [Coprinopsis cinerea okayama7\